MHSRYGGPATQPDMSYASCIVALAEAPTAVSENDKEYISAGATIPGEQPVNVVVRAFATGNAAKVFQDLTAGSHLLVAGEVQLDEDNDYPIIEAAIACEALETQYLNMATIVGRIAETVRHAESGKSCMRSVAVNRYYKNPDPQKEEPIEVTDWYPVRAYGFNRDKLAGIPKGALVMVSGSFGQMTNVKGEPYCELKARTIRVHRSRGGGGGNLAAGTTAAGYAHEDFQGSADDIGTNW